MERETTQEHVPQPPPAQPGRPRIQVPKVTIDDLIARCRRSEDDETLEPQSLRVFSGRVRVLAEHVQLIAARQVAIGRQLAIHNRLLGKLVEAQAAQTAQTEPPPPQGESQVPPAAGSPTMGSEEEDGAAEMVNRIRQEAEADAAAPPPNNGTRRRRASPAA